MPAQIGGALADVAQAAAAAAAAARFWLLVTFGAAFMAAMAMAA